MTQFSSVARFEPPITESVVDCSTTALPPLASWYMKRSMTKLYLWRWPNGWTLDWSSSTRLGKAQTWWHYRGCLTEMDDSVRLTSLHSLAQICCFLLKILFKYFMKWATLMRRTTVLSLPPQLVFLGINPRPLPALHGLAAQSNVTFNKKDNPNRT